ncbi:MAG: hypothetical protein KBT34_10365 [Prevotella sp.]|nr:hypothetical protein [Candidatus Prevotella equi]
MIYTITIYDTDYILHDEEGYAIELEEVIEIIRRRYRRKVTSEDGAYIFKVDSRRIEEMTAYLKRIDGLAFEQT